MREYFDCLDDFTHCEVNRALRLLFGFSVSACFSLFISPFLLLVLTLDWMWGRGKDSRHSLPKLRPQLSNSQLLVGEKEEALCTLCFCLALQSTPSPRLEGVFRTAKVLACAVFSCIFF